MTLNIEMKFFRMLEDETKKKLRRQPGTKDGREIKKRKLKYQKCIWRKPKKKGMKMNVIY